MLKKHYGLEHVQAEIIMNSTNKLSTTFKKLFFKQFIKHVTVGVTYVRLKLVRLLSQVQSFDKDYIKIKTLNVS